MRTTIEIDDNLMRRAMRSGKTRTKRATVEAGLKLLIQTHEQISIRHLRGKVQFLYADKSGPRHRGSA